MSASRSIFVAHILRPVSARLDESARETDKRFKNGKSRMCGYGRSGGKNKNKNKSRKCTTKILISE